MIKTATVFLCIECGAEQAKWAGQCTVCNAWNTIVEETIDRSGDRPTPTQLAPTVRLSEVDAGVGKARSTAIDELDRVLGGGLVGGSVTLLGGEPGIGKSTLVLQLLSGWPGSTLYVSAEESPGQVKGRAERLNCAMPDGWIAAETSLRGVLAAIDEVGPELVVVDSIQTIADERVSSSPGSPTQVRTCAQQLVVEAKRRGVAIVLVGHVTKDGTLAGPRQLEHAVDTVLSFEGDRHHALRLLRAAKHRFGPTSELGLFEMTDGGLVGVPDPSHLFLADRRRGVAGSVIVPAMAGQRPLLVEVQALTVPVPQGAQGRRNANGLDSGRLAMLLAVIERRAGLAVSSNDVYVSTVGGARLTEPGADLAVAMAVIGAVHDAPMARDLVVLGELGLGGEVRQVAQTPRRLAEAARLGYRRAIVPGRAPAVDGISIMPVDTLADAVVAAHGPSGSDGP
ncbi:MAG TPA: DNA repair protein RadA [Desertimonas sp.]|nr:DNA repair protein RadA [Desertimonas sp.]